ncbi:DNA polymerase III subunit delta' [Streptococcus hyointestinalis]|uniref:DNA polymerase III subunit delta n=1 Tax=Streptococcus hyointestinalis TaxID=1337 RepID=A0A380K5N4_9STRE|nr:DNA polymerase III subunit delta' [Streptococcus hyointestinalis]SUN60382.1 DNA polymerase III subunit delta' [Streptococcus hyointestinalis]
MTSELEQLQPQLFQQFKTILQTNRLSHAYLFSGGFASFEMALFLAQSRFCDNLQDKLPCGICRSCRLISQVEFSDVKLVAPSGNSIKTETIRNLIKEFSSSGFEGENQVFIIKDCEKMHVNAANSLLKVIEEPQSSVLIILLTSDESKVLATIKSRTQVFHFPKNQAYLEHMAEQKGFLKSQAYLLASVAKDSADLEQLMANNQSLALINECQEFVDMLLKNRNQAYLELSRLVALASDKSEQELAYQFLTLILAKHLNEKAARELLEGLHQSYDMWRKNVSFQNALEYMVLS